MSQIADFYKSRKYIFLWTISYIVIVWLILMFMFNFNIFSGTQWHMLTHAQLHGFAGFVFGILILATVPMYIATTCLIARTNQPLITIKITYITKIFNAVITRMTPVPAQTTQPISITQSPTIEDSDTPIPETERYPDKIPQELRGAFIRARQHIDNYPRAIQPVPVMETKTNITDADTTTPGELPIPADFDFNDPINTMPDLTEAPTFTNIDFDDEDAPNSELTESASTTTNTIIQYLNNNAVQATTENNLIITSHTIIATHDDPDFWIADPENWFAAGKQKPSPIIELIKASAIAGLQPILYLAQTNIMDIDKHRTEWTNMGITVITDLSELPM